MATGLPTIVADNTGLETMCDDRYNWPVPTLREEYCPQLGTWRIPNWDYAIDCMRSVYQNREAAYEKAQKGARWFIENHGAAAAAKQMRKILNKRAKPLPDIPFAETESDWTAHQPFFEQVAALPEPIMVVGYGTGQLVKYLKAAGKRPLVVLTPEEGWANRKCAEMGVRAVMGNIFNLESLPRAASVVSQGVLQQYNFEESRRILNAMYRAGRNVWFSVPSAMFPEPFMPGARPQRLPYWHEVLRGYEAPVRYYNNKQHIMGRIAGPGSPYGETGGRFLDGEWHQK